MVATNAAVSPTRISLPSRKGRTGTETARAGTAAGIDATSGRAAGVSREDLAGPRSSRTTSEATATVANRNAAAIIHSMTGAKRKRPGSERRP